MGAGHLLVRKATLGERTLAVKLGGEGARDSLVFAAGHRTTRAGVAVVDNFEPRLRGFGWGCLWDPGEVQEEKREDEADEAEEAER